MLSIGTIVISGGVIFAGLQIYDKAKDGSTKLLQSKSSRTNFGKVLANEANKSLDLETLESTDDSLIRTTGVVALTAVTSAIHLNLGGTLFALNGTGFIVLLVLYLAPPFEEYRNLTRDVFIAYTGVTFGGYFAVNGLAGLTNTLGMASKVVEVGLVALLWQDRTEALYGRPQPALAYLKSSN